MSRPAIDNPPRPGDWGPTKFDIIAPGQHYRLSLPGLDIVLDFDRVRRERGELHGHLTARCGMAGARVIADRVLLSGTTNLGSMQTRKRVADLLQDRALAKDVDFHGLLEELALRAEQAESVGEPAVNLAHVTPAAEDASTFDVKGIRLSTSHATMIHGLGDTFKSQIQLIVLAEVQRAGIPAMCVDWENMGAEQWARRLRMFYGDNPPGILYVRATRPLVDDLPRLQRIIHDHQIGFAGFDSVGFGCAGPPEQAEHALAFMRAINTLGIGSLLIAHESKGQDTNSKTPFGSAFWFNSARAIYSVRREEQSLDDNRVNVALFPTKNNLAKRSRPVGLEFHFDGDRATVEQRDVADMGGDLAARLSVPQRMRAALKRGPMTVKALAEELGVEENTITVNVSRGTKDGARRWLVKMPGSDGLYRIGLMAAGGR